VSAPRTLKRAVLAAVRAAALGAALSACSVLPPPSPMPVVFDLGLEPALAGPAAAAAGAVQVIAAPWLDGTAMLYRLAYVDSARLASYRDSRWAAPPAALLQERLKQRLARTAVGEAGAAGAADLPTLRIEVAEFCQVFDSPTSSRAVVQVRAALLEAGTGRVLRQRAFAQEVSAASADAPGGVRALVQASEATVAKVMAWAAASG
jgi:cholesterol transport system auxiliary component